MNNVKLFFKIYGQIVALSLLITTVYLSVHYMFIITHHNYEQANMLIDKSPCFVSRTIAIGSLEKLPSHHLDIIKDSGYEIEINDLVIQKHIEQTGQEHVAGLINYTDKKIYLQSNIAYVDVAILHEVGHLMSRTDGTILNDAEFQQCYEIEKTTIRVYARSSISEYFAELYMLQFMDDRIHKYDADDFPLSSDYLTSLEWW